MLAVELGDRLLEIGGGPGVAASLVCDPLGSGSLLLIDRSTTAIERTRRRNPEHVASGRLALQTVDVADFDPGTARFDKVFAVNVNVFWTTPRRKNWLAYAGRSNTTGGSFSSTRRQARRGPGRSSDGWSMRSGRTASHNRNSSRARRSSSGAWRTEPEHPTGFAGMERLWSRAVATDGNRWQSGRSERPLKQAKTVAVDCGRRLLPRSSRRSFLVTPATLLAAAARRPPLDIWRSRRAAANRARDPQVGAPGGAREPPLGYRRVDRGWGLEVADRAVH